MRLLDQCEHLLGKCRVLWDELQRRDIEEDYDNLVDVSRHDSAVVVEEERRGCVNNFTEKHLV